MKDGHVRAEPAGERCVDEVAGIVGTQLQQHAQGEFAERLTVKAALDGSERVAPGERIDAQRRAVSEDRGKQLRWAGGFVSAEGESHVVVAAQVAEAAQVGDEKVNRWTMAIVGGLAALNFLLDLGKQRRQVAAAAGMNRVRQDCG